MGTTLPGCGTVKSPFRNVFTIKAEDGEEWNRERGYTEKEINYWVGSYIGSIY